MKYLLTPLYRVVMICAMIVVIIASCKKSDQSSTQPDPVAPLPVVTNVQPKNPIPGDVVTITGTNFGTTLTDVKVTIGSQVITVTSVSSTEIKFTLPAGITAGDIAVAIKNIIANNIDPQKATITPQQPTAPVATITGINPATGKVGDVVTITGTNFSTTAADDMVKFNGVTATITAATATTLTTTVPATATTGAVTLSVKAAAVVTGPAFTVNATTGGTGSTPPYITIVSGTAKFTKLVSAAYPIGDMVVDKAHNTLYYSDYTTVTPNHPGTVYKLKLDGSAPVILSADSRINTATRLGFDPAGNVIVFTGITGPNSINVYNVNAVTGTVTVLGSNLSASALSNYSLVVDSQGALWLGNGYKLNPTTNTFDFKSTAYQSYSSAFYQGDDLYVDDAKISANGENIGYVKFNLLSGIGVRTDFTLKTLFEQDYPKLTDTRSTSYNISTRYSIDGNENFYAIYPTVGDVSSSAMEYFIIRKTKNGNAGASTLLTKFYTTPYSIASPIFYQSPRDYTGLNIQADAIGNLYLKCNSTDIVKITQ